MAGSRNKGNPGFIGWIDDRFPLTAMWDDHLAKYYAPKTLTSGTSSAHWPYWFW